MVVGESPRYILEGIAFGGMRKVGNGRTRIPLLVSLSAQGDGPDAFLEEIAKASEAAAELFDEPFGFSIAEDCGAYGMASPERIGDGGFERNGEEGKKPFLYLETWRVTVEFTPEDIPVS
ncbi:MAG: hypothetical protein HC888_09345 [Candidatus Competibacteraceae bacterium]|nr:hypothetical protein [Candidatus Competibacteraceae bacterium]